MLRVSSGNFVRDSETVDFRGEGEEQRLFNIVDVTFQLRFVGTLKQMT